MRRRREYFLATAWGVDLLLGQANRLLDTLVVRQEILDILLRLSASRDEKDAKKGQQAASDELDALLARRLLEVAVQDRAAKDDTEREEDKLYGDDLG